MNLDSPLSHVSSWAAIALDELLAEPADTSRPAAWLDGLPRLGPCAPWAEQFEGPWQEQFGARVELGRRIGWAGPGWNSGVG